MTVIHIILMAPYYIQTNNEELYLLVVKYSAGDMVRRDAMRLFLS